jgi:hypothetical protein
MTDASSQSWHLHFCYPSDVATKGNLGRRCQPFASCDGILTWSGIVMTYQMTFGSVVITDSEGSANEVNLFE